MLKHDFWNAFKSLCDERGTTPNAVGRELGLSSGSLTSWKNGRKPKMETIGRLAAYFNVPLSVFFGVPAEETKKAPAETAGATEDDIRFALFGDAPITDEDMEAVRTFAQMLAEKARKKKESDD